MAKILVSDKHDKAGMEVFKQHPDLQVDIKTGLKPEELKAIIGEYDVLMVRSATKPNADILSAATKLKLITRAGEGTDNIDKKFAAEKGIAVENTPGQNSHAVAELTIGLIFTLARHLARAHTTTKAGQWEKNKLEGQEIKGKTLGLIGAGKIGKDVAAMAKVLGMKVICYEVAKGNFDFPIVSLDELLAQADFISVHVPLIDATRGMIGAAQLAKMKKTAYIINCARGGIIDEPALAEACKNGTIAGAAIDCYTKEPVPADHPFLGCDNVVCIPHLGASSAEAQINCSVAAAEQVVAFCKEGKILNKVN
ncbi:MAG TPA: hydroxyacid dehydrogenase [bacterium]|nr:hydroxyacid dehydrogenase [bacterium]